jgi:hypothetical protein
MPEALATPALRLVHRRGFLNVPPKGIFTAWKELPGEIVHGEPSWTAICDVICNLSAMAERKS